MMAHPKLLIPLECPLVSVVPRVGFIMFQHLMEKLLNIEQFFFWWKKTHLNQKNNLKGIWALSWYVVEKPFMSRI
jgi:hypothetical protein